MCRPVSNPIWIKWSILAFGIKLTEVFCNLSVSFISAAYFVKHFSLPLTNLTANVILYVSTICISCSECSWIWKSRNYAELCLIVIILGRVWQTITFIAWSIQNHPINQEDIFHRLKKEQSRYYLPRSNPFHVCWALQT